MAATRPRRAAPAPRPRITADRSAPLVLAIDTSGPVETTLLLQGSLVLADQRLRRPRRRGTALGVGIRDLLDGVDRTPADLTAIGVVTGPGAFTGLRVGIATAHGLARACRIPLFGYDATLAMACGATPGVGRVGVLLDARRDEVYTALYALRADDRLPTAVRPTTVESAAAFVAVAGPEPIFLVGDGARLYSSLLEQALPNARVGHLTPVGPDLSAIARDVVRRLEGGFPGPVADVQPLYLRDHDAAQRSSAPG